MTAYKQVARTSSENHQYFGSSCHSLCIMGHRNAATERDQDKAKLYRTVTPALVS